MASSSPAPETWAGPSTSGPLFDGEPVGEWNPTADSTAPVRGRHRVVKQRGGGMARSGAVLGVGVIAAVGAGGMATAKDRPPAPISLPDLSPVTDKLPAIDSLVGGSNDVSATASRAPLSQAGLTTDEIAQGADAGEALRARIMRQAEQQQSVAETTERLAAEQAAREKAAEDAAAKKAEAEAAKKKAAEEAERKAAEEAARKAEEERLAKLAASYALPLSSYTLTSSFGESGSMWSSSHTGQDFAAPTGTPVKAVHGGTITEAGWAGSYGYRIILTLDDGTEIWYCHLSSMTVTSGEVTTGDTIGRVGSTGNSSGPHLHLEVRPGGGDPVNPAAWLRDHGKNI
ncbi:MULTISPECIES: M23 family metallopeptidase [Streptomyces]|uniref:M23 family metallopeptidase n=1 Tax=Streptomyces TaxID=1883 RepID=UPI001D156B16|nr:MULTISPECIES: M23 family metallopeptidase [Streptomyces]MCC3653063.1 M23 family metallopeptidase [Streptomyces sp. S07_1.15]WSQ72311.1 M23 family metallopeptidase [Streptomyces xinghaiensis]